MSQPNSVSLYRWDELALEKVTEMTYVLQGALKFLIAGEEITVREGEVLHIPSWVEHQAEALDDTFELDLFAPIRQDWLDHTDAYFHRK